MRERETSEERDARLEADRQHQVSVRARETSEERDARLGAARQHQVLARARESSEDRAARLRGNVERAVRRNRPQLEGISGVGFSYDPQVDYASHTLLSIGGLTKICRFCSAQCFVNERPGLCCNDGKVRLDPLQPPSDLAIRSLYEDNFALSANFIKDVRKYNSCFQMTSFGVDGTSEHIWSTFRIHGQIYHQIGSLLPLLGRQPKFAQIYFVGDTNTQIGLRHSLFDGLNRHLMELFQKFLDGNNALIREFKTGIDQLTADDRHIVIRGNPPPNEHPGRFNAPRVDEVAVIAINAEYTNRDIVIRRRDNRLTRICETHPHYDALQYPLIFWSGQSTYHFDIPQFDPRTNQVNLNKTVSMMSYYCYHLMIRESSARNFLLRCGQLLNQFVVDTFWRVEAERLIYIRNHQAALRCDEYIHLRDAMNNDGDAENIGQHVILPSTFIGSPRYLHEYTQDAMAYVRLHSRPDLFITFTCNPNWPEIVNLRFEGQRSNVRHDLIARVFHEKQTKLLAVLTKHNLFGPTRCFVSAIEWQKRGLPHSHTLIWLERRLRPDDIDRVISAERPDQAVDPVLHKIITENMIHGPCGVLNTLSPCMVDGKCTKKYPRALIC